MCETTDQEKKNFGIHIRAMAGMCHRCIVCRYADKKPDTLFGRLMRWHRTWCPAWAAHTKVYGEKPLSK